MVEIGRLIDDHVDRWTDKWKEGGEKRRMGGLIKNGYPTRWNTV